MDIFSHHNTGLLASIQPIRFQTRPLSQLEIYRILTTPQPIEPAEAL